MHHISLCAILWLILSPDFSHAQFKEDFSDGDFTNDPTWHGDTANFRIFQQRLYLDAPSVTDTQVIATACNVALDASWSLSMRLDFNPSTGNYCKIYLMSSHADLNKSLEAYFVKVGGADDEVSLYRQDGRVEIELIDGRNQVLNKSVNDLKIKVSRSIFHRWTLETDSGSSIHISEGSAVDSTYLQSRYFGLSCRHTSTRSDKFSFDDVEVIGKPYEDKAPPKLVNSSIEDEGNWFMEFDESVLIEASTKITTNWLSGQPILKLDPSDPRKITAEFPADFPHGQELTLRIDSLRDSLGNASSILTSGIYNDADQIHNKSVVINEIMFDPSPVVELPDAEYLELYNPSAFIIQLKNWSLSDEKDTLYMPDHLLLPGGYIVLCHAPDSALLYASTSILGLEKFISLSNEGEEITLFDSRGSVVDHVHYRPDWITETTKKEGGYSLELIDPLNHCGTSSNWKASKDPTGGSPGLVNSVYDTTTNLPEKLIARVLTVNDSLVTLSVSQSLKWPENVSEHLTSSPELKISEAEAIDTLIFLYPAKYPQKNRFYQVTIDDLLDCRNRLMDPLEIKLVFPEGAEWSDLIINEVLFNPIPGGSDFIEIHNRSVKYLDLNSILVGSIREEGQREIEPLTSLHRLMPPGTFLAICQDTLEIKLQYPFRGPLFEADLPYMGDESGSVFLMVKDSTFIDAMEYNENMHFALIDDAEGVSLEKIDPKLDGRLPGNWHSAASTSAFASPGLKNSQLIAPATLNNRLVITPDLFSPDNDGFQDLVTIRVNLGKEGFVGSLRIIHPDGKVIRVLASNELLSINNVFTWDGTDQNNGKARVGYYLVLLEAFHLEGEVIRESRSIVLAHYL